MSGATSRATNGLFIAGEGSRRAKGAEAGLPAARKPRITITFKLQYF